MALTQVQQGMLTTQAQYTGFKNRIINGAMVIDQRNGGASVTISSNVYTLDRWLAVQTQASKYSVQRNAGAVTPPAGFINYLGTTSLAATTVGSGDLFFINQRVEGLNVTDLGWGTANAQAVTLSFWVRSSLTGTFGGSLRNSASNRSYPFTYTISAANTWEYETITIPGDTTGTWLTDNGIGIDLALSIGMGSTYSSTAGAWATGNYVSATGATSVVGTNGATFYITGVQLEKGSTATSFDYRPYGTELSLCQRYYEVFGNGGVGGTRGSTNIFAMGFKFQVTKRASPTITQLASFSVVAPGISGYTISSINAIASVSTTGVFTELNSTTNGSSSYPMMYGNSSIADLLSASAEL